MPRPGTAPDVPDSVFRRGWRLIRRSLRTHPLAHATAIMGANVFALAVVGFTVIVGRVTDDVIVPGLDGEGVSRRSLLVAVATIVGIGVVRGASIMVRRWFNMLAIARTQRTWRLAVTDRFLDAPLDFHRSRPAGLLLAHADADVEVATAMLMPLAFSMSVVLLAVASLVSLLVVHPLFACVALLLFPTLTVLNRRFTSAVEAPAALGQDAVGVLSGIAHESLDGVMAVKTLGREDEEVARFTEVADELRGHRMDVGRLRSGYAPVIYALPNLGIIILLVLGAWLVGRGAVSIGDVVRAMSLFSILTLPMEILGYMFQEMPRSVVAMDRIDRVLAVGPEARPDPVPPVGDRVAVEFDGVSYAYQPVDKGAARLGGAKQPISAPVLADLSFRIQPGESVAMVGATGSGKSTMVSLLCGLVQPTAGRVLLGGVDVSELGSDGASGIVAPVLQETFLFADTVRDNLTLGNDVTDEEIDAALVVVAADGFVAALPDGLDTVVGERGSTLSGGQRQRLAIARALLRRPRVLVLDDSTSAVDPTIEAGILRNLRVAPGTGRGGSDAVVPTLLVIAHRLATIRMADRVLFLEGGSIAASGSHEELLDVPAYAALARAYEEAGL